MSVALSESALLGGSLRCERLAWAEWGRAQGPVLGGLCWGEPAALPAAPPPGALVPVSLPINEPMAAPSWATRLAAPLLAPQAPCIDVWRASAEPRQRQRGALRWQDDGRWLFGSMELDLAGRDLVDAARQAYLDLFGALKEAGAPHMLRLWNYLPGINEDGGGLERYRQFNVGRQQAFIEAGMDAFEGAPAACALGVRGGPLAIRFLAAREPALPIENPRQVPAYRYSAEYGPRSPTFSRAALADAGGGELMLLISGTASIVGERSLHLGDVGAQVEEIARNLQALLEAAHARGSARFELPALECVVYLRHAEHLGAVQRAWQQALGSGEQAQRAAASAVYLQADICRSELLVEVEAHGFAPGELWR